MTELNEKDRDYQRLEKSMQKETSHFMRELKEKDAKIDNLEVELKEIDT
jgi:hypothetical protein